MLSNNSNNFDIRFKNIAFINYTASGGGAGKICSLLHKSFQGSVLYNKYDKNEAKNIVQIDNFTFRNFFHRLLYKLQAFFLEHRIAIAPRVLNFIIVYISEPIRTLKNSLGFEDFHFPGTSCPSRYFIKEPKLVHAHNLFPNYFDFKSIKILSEKYPLLLTAHDCWLMTGHCAHPINCNLFKTGCGQCPDLKIPPSIKRDRTKQNLKTKKKILVSSKLYLATPCQWLKEMFMKSQVGDAFQEIRVIPNGVNTNHFFPISNKKAVRKKYNLKENALIFSFAGNKTKQNPWKNFKLMLHCLQSLAQKLTDEVIFLCIGEKAECIRSLNFTCHFVGQTENINQLNDLYNCSDFYIHLANADTFPNTILEAQSCGIPVFANPVCGIVEQVLDGTTGWLLDSSDPNYLANRIASKLSLCNYSVMQKNCRSHILNQFSEEKMLARYKAYYSEILDNRSNSFKN